MKEFQQDDFYGPFQLPNINFLFKFSCFWTENIHFYLKEIALGGAIKIFLFEYLSCYEPWFGS